MSLNGASGLLLLAVTWALYWLSPARGRAALLLAASVVFYASNGTAPSVVVAVLVAVTWLAGKAIEAKPTRLRLGLSIALAVAILGVYKYTGMVVKLANGLAARADVPLHLTAPAVVVPLGLSFITFALIHFLIEVYRGAAVLGPIRFATYVSFFPTVAMGPIKRYPAFADDLARLSGRRDEATELQPALADGPGAALATTAAPAALSATDIREGLGRIVLGLVRKMVIADTLVPFTLGLHDPDAGRGVLLLSLIAFSLRIYFDFAGYSDIAIGAARLFGFRIMENFDRPYLQRNVSEFWSHWHMSLTKFITEYIYIPLGGSRRGPVRVAVNTMTAMGISGLWHGAGLNFIAWGLYHGAGLVVLRLWTNAWKRLRSRSAALDTALSHPVGRRLLGLVSWALTIAFVWLGWVLFACTFREALTVYARLAGGAANPIGLFLTKVATLR